MDRQTESVRTPVQVQVSHWVEGLKESEKGTERCAVLSHVCLFQAALQAAQQSRQMEGLQVEARVSAAPSGQESESLLGSGVAGQLQLAACGE